MGESSLSAKGLLILCIVSASLTYCSTCDCVGDITVNCAGDAVCTSDCNRATRYAEERDCVFPFQYNGTWYDTCISKDKGFWWCSLTKVYTNAFAPCAAECPILAQEIAGTGKTHSACATPGANKISYPPNNAMIALIVDYHNWVRSNVSANINQSPGPYNPDTASYMRKLYWDADLASLAQRWADRGIFQHDCSTCRILLNRRSIRNGQNIYASTGGPPSLAQQESYWRTSMHLWQNEKTTWNYDTGGTGVTGHYTQMIWDRTARVGCGMAYNSDQRFPIYVVCNYVVSGNFVGQKPFAIGQACADCPNSCENNLCTCNKVCQNNGVLDKDACTCSCPSTRSGDECEKLVV